MVLNDIWCCQVIQLNQKKDFESGGFRALRDNVYQEKPQCQESNLCREVDDLGEVIGRQGSSR